MNEENPSSPHPEDKIFTKFWNLAIGDVLKRKNFKEHHLDQLRILCGLYSEYHTVDSIIKEEGYTFSSSGRYGEQLRPRPEIAIRDKILGEIRLYSRMLGLVLEKDQDTNENPEDESQWS